jgi:hypothetical protein
MLFIIIVLLVYSLCINILLVFLNSILYVGFLCQYRQVLARQVLLNLLTTG